MVYISNGELKGQRGRPPVLEAGPRVSLHARPPARLRFPVRPRPNGPGGEVARPATAPQPIVPEPAAGLRSPDDCCAERPAISPSWSFCLWVLKSGLSFSGVSVLKY